MVHTKKHLLAILLLLFIFGSCNLMSDQIRHSFQTVDSSLEKSNRLTMAENKYTLYYLDIQQKGEKHPDLARNADSLYAAASGAVKLIDQIKQILQEKDSTGANDQVAGALLVNTPLGDSLKLSLLQVYDRCYTGLISPGKRASLDSCLHDFQKIRTERGWAGTYFANTPTVAAFTILNYHKSQCLQATTLTLGDIDAQLK